MKPLLLTLLLALTPAAKAGETGAVLKIGVGARAVGMGGAYTALADDETALYWNPAGLSDLSRRELSAMHAEMTAGVRYDYAGFAQPTKLGTFGASAGYLSQGAMDARDENGHQTGSFGASDSVVSLGYAAKLVPGMRLGGAVKFIDSRIANYTANGFAADFGAQYAGERFGPGVPLFGAAVQNLGPGMRYADQASPLPLTLAAGLGYRLPAGMTLALDFKQRPNGGTSEVDVGTEYAMFSSLALRLGYGSNHAAVADQTKGLSAASGFAAGFGLKLSGYTLDYSMTPFGELGNVQRFSLGARF